jgi:pimeloyl-ACP methyl ester carboxylesterase
MESRCLKLSDGRLLEYVSSDVVEVQAVIFHQGTLLDMSSWTSWLEELAAHGVRGVAFNRSGYGLSSPKTERRTVDVGRDVSELVDHLGLSGFVSVGWSGGGSHALATSLDSRCRGVVTLAGIAAFAQDDLDFYDGMKDDDIAEYHAALRNTDELLAMIADPEHGTTWCEPDARAMATPEMREVTASMERTVSFGWGCLVDDYSSYLSPWGFDVAGVTVPVVIFQGDRDENVPLGHARWLHRHIPGSRLNLYPGEGHLSLVFTYRRDIVATVLSLLHPDAETPQ